MHDGFVPVAAISPHIRLADVEYNAQACVETIHHAHAKGARVIVLPELCLTGSTCGDLFWQDTLLVAAEKALVHCAKSTSQIDAVVLLGAPIRVASGLYNCAVVMAHGEILGVVPKQNLSGKSERGELRHFTCGPRDVSHITLGAIPAIPFGARLLFACRELRDLVLGVEIGEDLWSPCPPSIEHTLAGATLICNLSASNECAGKATYRRALVCGQSARLVCGYAYASAGRGESTGDYVFGGHTLICESNRILNEAPPFTSGYAVSEIDVSCLATERRRIVSGSTRTFPADYTTVEFSLERKSVQLTRTIDPYPFVPPDNAEHAERCEEIFAIQVYGLVHRLEHIHAKRMIIGVSGGLDSALTLLVCARTCDVLGLDRKNICALTMPGLGTSDQTRDNAVNLAIALGCELREISICKAVRAHFADIGHDEKVPDVTYENAQARERMQVLMDVANQEGGLVVGTGDLSELALGWTTYNGDHMSMYGVNASIPKTLARCLVDHSARTGNDKNLSAVLKRVLETPVSPELLPVAKNGAIAQETENIVGPYELHDFILYATLRQGFSPAKVYRLARHAFGSEGRDPLYDDLTILKWMKTFYTRFFSQQFKRSCSPDGPTTGPVAIGPRGGLQMPSDAVSDLWLKELETL